MSDSLINFYTAHISNEGRYVRGLLSSFVREEALDPILEEIDWQNFNRIAKTQAIVAICRHLIPANIIPDEIRLHWDQICTENFLDNSMALNGAQRILAVLERGGIPAAVLRGIRMAYEIYPDPVMRPMGDVDILIPPDSPNAVIELLAKAEMHPAKILRSQLVYHINRKDYEIHWSYVTPLRYRGVAGFNKWLDDTQAVSTPQGKVRSLRIENELLGLVIHSFVHHELDRISQAVDIALVLKRKEIDWEYIKCWAENARLSRMVAFVLDYVAWLFTMPTDNWSSWSRKYLPANQESNFISYATQSLGQDARIHYLKRKAHQLEVAETFPIKARQLLRFLTLKDMKIFVTSMFPGSKGKQMKGKS